MDMNEYQKQAKVFDVSGERINLLSKEENIRNILQIAYSLSGLAEEIGELEGKFKRYLRGDIVRQVFEDEVLSELGDVLWCLSDTAGNLGFTLEEIAKGNLYKLTSRMERGKIKGSGDNR